MMRHKMKRPERLRILLDAHGIRRRRLAGWLVACGVLMGLLGTVWLAREVRAPEAEEKAAGGEALTAVACTPAALLEEAPISAHYVSERFEVQKGGASWVVQTGLDPGLQAHIEALLLRSQTHGAGVVALDPLSGRILALAGYNGEGLDPALCLTADFPAASLFKIVSAAAALESAGYTPDKPVAFKGQKHTLYKKQLQQQATGRWVSQTTFRKAFASSINPVFGKLGIYSLGQDGLAEYAGRFGFNQPIPFEFPVEQSTICVPGDEFGLAEIASGFNKATCISPLHAVLIAAAVVNEGRIMMPWLVQAVADKQGHTVYTVRPRVLAAPITPATAKGLRVMMRDTVRYGTCRKTIRRLAQQKRFRNVEFGAKTGTINDAADRYKYDWVAGYALPADGTGGICLGVLCIHGERLGTRAGEMTRAILNFYLRS